MSVHIPPSQNTSGVESSGELPAGWIVSCCPICESHSQERIIRFDRLGHRLPVALSLTRCDCGMLVTNPQPRGEVLAAFYREREYYTHSPQNGIMHPVRSLLRRLQMHGPFAHLRLGIETITPFPRFAKRNMFPHFSLPRRASLLDFGCGSGNFLNLARDLGLCAVGIEPDPQARRVASITGTTVVGSLQEADEVIGNGDIARFDRIVLRHVLEHLPQPLATLQSLAARLLPEGQMLIVVPNAESAQAIMFGQFWHGYDVPRHLWHFTRLTLRRIVEMAGLSSIALATIEVPQFATASKARMSEELPGIRIPPSISIRSIEARGQGSEIAIVATLSHSFRQKIQAGIRARPPVNHRA